MLEKEPVFTYCWMVGLAALGGVAGYLRKIRQGLTKKFSIVELACEMVISVFVGAVTLLMCDSHGVDKATTGAMVGLAGHLGSRAIYILEVIVSKKIGIPLTEDRRKGTHNVTEFNRREGDE